MPPSPPIGTVDVERSIDRHAKLITKKVDHARGHRTGVLKERAEKTGGSKLKSAAEPHMRAAVCQHECAIGVVQVEVPRQLFGRYIGRKATVPLLLLRREETDRHQSRSVSASTR